MTSQLGIALILMIATLSSSVAQEQADEQVAVPDVPERYVLDYPAADAFCVPIRSTFFEANRQFSIVRGRRIRHAPNGGYGLAVVDKIGTKNLLHVGADLGWYQVGEPVRAIANGVVRISIGPVPQRRVEGLNRQRQSFLWGNLVVVEHKLDDDQYFTTIYGHLGSKRFVKAGDLVTAGQPLGTIGKQNPKINGGYKPHLHFGIRDGRLGHVGMSLVPGAGNLRVESIAEERITFKTERRWAFMTVNGKKFEVTNEGETASVPSSILWNYVHPEFPIVGYALQTDGFHDPIAFLRKHRATVVLSPR